MRLRRGPGVPRGAGRWGSDPGGPAQAFPSPPPACRSGPVLPARAPRRRAAAGRGLPEEGPACTAASRVPLRLVGDVSTFVSTSSARSCRRGRHGSLLAGVRHSNQWPPERFPKFGCPKALNATGSVTVPSASWGNAVSPTEPPATVLPTGSAAGLARKAGGFPLRCVPNE